MKFRIGFTAPVTEEDSIESAPVLTTPRKQEAVKSLVQIRFPSRNMTLAYFNDKFDLRRGDLVYVDGKLEGHRGIVVDVAYNFKIKISQYQKVIALVDTEIHGQFYMAGSHFVTFNRDALPQSKIVAWFKAPDKDDDEYVTGEGDDTSFALADLKGFKISSDIAERGHEYYIENRVRYIFVDGTKGYAIVEGTEGYEVEFTYSNGRISHLICNCFCSYNCKHEFAVLLQLRETLDLIEKNYASEYRESGYFAAICKGTLFSYSVDGKEAGKIIL